MKKFLLFNILSVVVCFGVLCFVPTNQPNSQICAVYAAETTIEEESPLNEESQESNYFREKIMPYIAANLSAILSAFLVVMTTLGKIKAATTELKASNSENVYLKKRNKQLETDIDELKKEVASLKKDAAATKEMVRIGFCNTSELVENGFAAEIAKVGENEEESKS